jgi:DNA-binding MarR family transcriptional regulator
VTLAVHNVVQLSDDEVRARFVVRHRELAELIAHLREDGPPRHALVIGPRGMGKSLLLRRVAITVADDPELVARWLVVILPEELYDVTSVAELWLAALSTAARQLDDAGLAAQHAALLAERDPARLEALALQRLLSAARSRGRRLLLLAENLDMLLHDQVGGEEAWTLRQALHNEHDLLLMASSVTSFAQVEEASEALYGFFHRIDLRPLGDDDVRAIWREVTGVTLEGDRVVPIRVLTGGNPRMVAVLASFSRDRDLSSLRQDLELLIDEYTPFFKANVEALAPIERKVFTTLADIWAPATAAEVAERARMTSSQVSALLTRLQRRGAVEVVEDGDKGGRRRYELTERLYNLYHLLRRPDGKGRVRALVDILVHLYDPASLERDVWPGLVHAAGRSEIDLHVAGSIERHIDDAGVWDDCTPDEARNRLAAFESRLPKQTATLGPDHPDTLLTRHQVAYYTGVAGDARRALALYRQVAADHERVLGPDHPHTLASRHGVAYYLGQTGETEEALQVEGDVVRRLEGIEGHDELRRAARWLHAQLETEKAIATRQPVPRELREAARRLLGAQRADRPADAGGDGGGAAAGGGSGDR